MNTEQLTKLIQLADAETGKLTAEMDAIFANYSDICEAPEFMPEDTYFKWSALHSIRKSIFNRITRLEQAANELNHYLKMEVI